MTADWYDRITQKLRGQQLHKIIFKKLNVIVKTLRLRVE